jgi:hypothetical protein
VILERPAGPDDVGRAVAALGLGGPRPVLTVIGGADGLDEALHQPLAALFSDVVVPALARHGAAALDGGTDSGVMRLFGRARAERPDFPLIGVAAAGTVEFPGNKPSIEYFARLDPNHTHFVLVPGDRWGAESAYFPLVAAALAAGAPRAAILINGGGITLTDAQLTVDHGTPLLVLSGTGRLADQIAAAVTAPAVTAPAVTAPAGGGEAGIGRLALSDRVRVLPVDDRTAVAAQLEQYLTA